MSLNIYYVCISIYGFWQWHKGKAVQEGTEVLILYRRLNIRLIWGITVVTVFFVRYVVFHFVGLYRFARIGRRCFYHSFEYYGNVDAGPENIGTLVVLGGDRRGVGIVVLSAGFVSDLLFICMLWRISDCRMDQLEKRKESGMIKRYKCVVVANGLFPTGQQALELLRQAEFVVACDGAVIGLENGRLPDAVVGDLDSLPEPVRNRYSDRIHRVKDQETNDLTKAVNYVKTLGFREVLILGATGRREDHTLGNISLLAQYVTEFERVEMVSDFGWFTPLYRTTTLDSEPGQQVSLFSLYPNGRISVSGLRYPIEKRRLLYWWEATLNEATGKEFTVILEEDARVLVYRTFSSL